MATNICTSCGHMNQEGSAFCERCGARLGAPSTPIANIAGAPKPVAVKKKSAKKIIIPVVIIAALLLAGGGAFAYTHFFKMTTVDLVQDFDDKVLELDGEDGEGSIVGIDENVIKEKLDYNDADKEIQDFIDSVEYTYNHDTDTSLGNGTKVTITATFDKDDAAEKNIKVKNADANTVETSIKIERLASKTEDQTANDASGVYNSDTTSNNYDLADALTYDDTDALLHYATGTTLSQDDIESLTDDDLQLLLNYIYAYNGREFKKDGENYAYFSRLSWYSPYTKDDKECEKTFSDIEKANKKALVKEREARKKK